MSTARSLHGARSTQIGAAALFAAFLISGAHQPAQAAPELVELQCPDGGALGRIWTRAESYVFTCTYGPQPKLARPDVWMADELAVYKRSPSESEPHLVLRAKRHQRPVEYWVDGSRLVVLQHTQDPRAKFPVPFARQTVAIDGDACEASVEVILEPEAADPTREAQLIDQLKTPAVSGRDATGLAKLLFELRNRGLRNPRAMAQELRSVPLPQDAASAHSQVLAELALAERSTAAPSQP